jgi:hypothetical protein
MRLTSFTDFGLRMLMRMAGEPARAFSTGELAQELNLSRHHLAKIMQRLAGAGLIATRRGAVAGRYWRGLPPKSGWAMSCGCWKRVSRLSSAWRRGAATARWTGGAG